MKVSEMIKNLQDFMRKHGDIECWYAVDDEGNGYSPIYYTPSLFYTDGSGVVYQPLDCERDEFEKICIVN